MCSVTPNQQSLQSISFSFSRRNLQLPNEEFLIDAGGLTYSNSFISASKQSLKQLPDIIQIDPSPPQHKEMLLPIIRSAKKYQVHNHSREFSPHCLNIVLKSVKGSPRNRHFNETDIRSNKKDSKGSLKKKESLSLPYEGKIFEQRNKQRSKTMLNLSVLKFIRDQQENYSPKKAEVKRKDYPMMKKKLKEQLNYIGGSVEVRQQPFQLLTNKLMAKKLSLGHNWQLQKKYLRKITQKRQTVRPCYPFLAQNA